MNRCADKFIAVADYLTDCNGITDLNSRGTRSADVLLHRQNYLFRDGNTNSLAACRVFVVVNLDAATNLFDCRDNSVHVDFTHLFNPFAIWEFPIYFFSLTAFARLGITALRIVPVRNPVAIANINNSGP